MYFGAPLNLFVPGRICLFGEHSDWAGSYRSVNQSLSPGRAIIACTEQGIHATVRPSQDFLIIRSTLPDGRKTDVFKVSMNLEALEAAARSGGFFSYAAGVAFEILKKYRVGGLEIDNHYTDLPVKKGLSSSAAFCVLTARAFSRMHGLDFSPRQELEFAYLGERLTGSECGRMDQGCAYGQTISMSFDGDSIDVQPFDLAHPLHLLLVDLCAEKDTRVILRELNRCYPFAQSEMERSVQEYLGPINLRICAAAMGALKCGDFERLGSLMNEAQQMFDAHVAPACLEQLTAPVLHQLLNSDLLAPHILGGKGVGSQGDGSVQFLVRNAASLEVLGGLIEDKLEMRCQSLVLGAN